jgi:hypothetical protein
MICSEMGQLDCGWPTPIGFVAYSDWSFLAWALLSEAASNPMISWNTSGVPCPGWDVMGVVPLATREPARRTALSLA